MDRFAENILADIKAGKYARIIALYGDLGSGKTAFTKSLAKSLGVEDEVNSPTFVIQKTYETKHKDFKKLIHIDAYRLEDGDDLLGLGFERDLGGKNNLIVIEWADIVEDILTRNTIKIRFSFFDENTREIVM